MSKQNIGAALAYYEKLIWAIADILYAHGFKASEWPKYMMPFFALILVESRIIREINKKIDELQAEYGVPFDYLNPSHVKDLSDSLENDKCGFHPELVQNQRSLLSICETQPANFYDRLMQYLSNMILKLKNF